MKRNLLLLLVLSVLTISAQTWKKTATIDASNEGCSIYFSDKNNGFAGMYSKIYSTSDGGVTWTEKNISYALTYFKRISFVNSDFGYAIGTSSSFLTQDGGATWTSNGTGGKGNDGFFIDKNTGVSVYRAVSTFPQIIKRTTNGGSAWDEVNNSALEKELYGIWFYNSTNGIAVGQDGSIVKTTNAGASWSLINTSYAQTMQDVHFPEGEISTGYIVAHGNPANQGYIYKTNDGGSTWSATGTAYVSAELESVFFINKLTGYVAGQRKVFKTTDGGATWNEQASEAVSNIKDIFFLDENTGFVICENGDFLSLKDDNSVNEISKELSANIYPNPAKDVFFIELTNTGLSKSVEVNIYNFVGKRKFSEQRQVHYKQKYEVSTEELLKGIYIVEIKYADRILRKKLIIE